MRILYLLFYGIICVYKICQSSPITIEENERILGLSSNGHILAVTLPSRLLIYSMISSRTQTSLEKLFSIEFDEKLPEEYVEFELLSDNKFILCSINVCRLYKINVSERSAQVSLTIDPKLEFKKWSAIVLDDRLLIGFLPKNRPNTAIKSYYLNNGSLIGEASDHFLITQNENIRSFTRGAYSYFINTVHEPDLYATGFRRIRKEINITRTRLTRICNNDDSADLITKINIHLACGQKPDDYSLYPIFDYQSSFLSTDGNQLFVVLSSQDNKYLSCSYSMKEIESYFDDIWNHCQDIENESAFNALCEKNISCTYTWKSVASAKYCRKYGYHLKRKISNCEAPTYNVSTNRYGWIENFFPIFGKIEKILPENQHFRGLDDNTFVTLNQNGSIWRLLVDAQQKAPLWSQKVEKFTTVQNENNQTSYVIYSNNNEVVAEQMTCGALYPNCKDINWEDPLKCTYCAFSNSTGYVTDIWNSQTCNQLGGQLVKEECAPTISNLQVTGAGVFIVGDLLDKFLGTPEVYVCEEDCEDVTVVSNLIQCKAEGVVSGCDVKVIGNLKHTSGYTLYLSNPEYDKLEDYDTTTLGKSMGKTTKFVIGIIAAIFFLAIIILIAYAIATRRCTSNDGHLPSKSFTSMQHGDFLGGLDSLVDAYNPLSTTETNNLEDHYGLTTFPNVNQIEMVKMIGKGNFATVYLYRYKNSPNNVVAVKEITDLREIKLISQCQHPNIVEYFGYFINRGRYCIVMEFLGGGDLHNYLTNRSNHFSCRQGFDMVLQIVSGMLYLAKKHIIHRDLAARNCIMSTDHETIKISDFGLGRKTNADEVYLQLSESKLPYRWTAFECLNGAPFTEKSDVWSFGVLMWEIFSRAKSPYADIKSADGVRQYLTSGERLLHPGEGCPNELYEIMLTCWEENPETRPTFNQLYNTIQFVVQELNESDVDYANIYLTPRASMNDANNSGRTIMDETEVNRIIRERSVPSTGHASFT